MALFGCFWEVMAEGKLVGEVYRGLDAAEEAALYRPTEFVVFAGVRRSIGEKCELFAVRGPARRFFGFLREGKLANAAGRFVVEPDVRGAAIVGGWLGDHEGQVRSIRR